MHVRDVAKAALTLLDAPEEQIRGEAFNIGTDEQNYLVRELAEILAGVTGCDVEIAEGSSADQRSYRVDFSKLAGAFPRLDFDWNAERGARELVDAYREVGLTRADFDGDRYIRLTAASHAARGRVARRRPALAARRGLADRPGKPLLALTRSLNLRFATARVVVMMRRRSRPCLVTLMVGAVRFRVHDRGRSPLTREPQQRRPPRRAVAPCFP